MAAAYRHLDSITPNPYIHALASILAVAPDSCLEDLVAMVDVAPNRWDSIDAIAAAAAPNFSTEDFASMAAVAPYRCKSIAAAASATAPAHVANPGTECLASDAVVTTNRDKESGHKLAATVAATIAANVTFVDVIEHYYVELMQKICDTLTKAKEANRCAKEQDDIVEILTKERTELVEMIIDVEDQVTERDEVVERLQKENYELTQKMNMEFHCSLKR